MKKKNSIKKQVMDKMLEIYYPKENRTKEKYIDWMGYPIDDNNSPTYHHITKAHTLICNSKDATATLENGAYLGELSHQALHFIESINSHVYDSWNSLFLVINRSKCYPSDEILKAIFELQKLSEDIIEEYNNNKKRR